MHYRIDSWQWMCIYYINGQQLLYGGSLIFKILFVVFNRNDTVQHSLGMVVLFILCNFILYVEPSSKASEVQLLKKTTSPICSSSATANGTLNLLFTCNDLAPDYSPYNGTTSQAFRKLLRALKRPNCFEYCTGNLTSTIDSVFCQTTLPNSLV